MLAITRMLRSALSEHLKACSEMRFCIKCVRWGMGTKFILIRFIYKNNFSEIQYINWFLSFLEIIIKKPQTHKIFLIPSHPHSGGVASRLIQPCSIFALRHRKCKGAFASLETGCDHTAATALAGTGAEWGSLVAQGVQRLFQDSLGVGSGSCEVSIGHCPSGSAWLCAPGGALSASAAGQAQLCLHLGKGHGRRSYFFNAFCKSRERLIFLL